MLHPKAQTNSLTSSHCLCFRTPFSHAKWFPHPSQTPAAPAASLLPSLLQREPKPGWSPKVTSKTWLSLFTQQSVDSAFTCSAPDLPSCILVSINPHTKRSLTYPDLYQVPYTDHWDLCHLHHWAKRSVGEIKRPCNEEVNHRRFRN